MLHAHPTVSDDLLTRLGHGDITVKPNIDRFEGSKVFFVDGSAPEVDVVVYCTGYKVTFPFLDEHGGHAPRTTTSTSTAGWSTRSTPACTSSG